MSINKVILIGHLGQNPEVRYTPSGAAVANFSIATNENWTDKTGQKQEKTEWHRIVVWGKTAENCKQYLAKGRQVFIEGRLQTRQWQDKDGQTKYTTEVQAQTVQFLGGGASGDRGRDQSSVESSNMGTGFGDRPNFGSSMGGDAPVNGAYQTAQSPQGRDQPFTEDDIPF